MVKTGNECLLENYISSRGKNCYGGLGWDRSTLRITGRDTAQTERILM